MEFVFISLIILAETAGQGFLKEYAMHLHPLYLALGAMCYFAVVVLLARALQAEGVGMVNMMWSVASIMSVFLVGMLFFHERMTAMQLFGAAMAVSGIVILKVSSV